MMRLPWFRYRTPKSVDEAVNILADEGSEAMIVAGGTDLWPNMKRRQQLPKTVVALRDIASLRKSSTGDGLRLGAALTLTDVVRDERVQKVESSTGM